MSEVKIYHTFISDDKSKTATVWFNGEDWGSSFYLNGSKVEERIFCGHSESYAEDAAENYVVGILQLNQVTQ